MKEQFEITKAVKGEVVDFKNPDPAFFQALGYDGMQDMMYKFYDKIYESDIAHFFPQDHDEFEEVKKKNTKFFIQICGGPSIYDESMKGVDLNKYMIDLHKDFSIYMKSRNEWLGIFREVLDEVDVAQNIKDDFWQYLDKFSKMTVNRWPKPSAYVN
ncbi:MAG: globin [Campylobacterota bacterium]|nr:globin [Campylobacterota bacterium]